MALVALRAGRQLQLPASGGCARLVLRVRPPAPGTPARCFAAAPLRAEPAQTRQRQRDRVLAAAVPPVVSAPEHEPMAHPEDEYATRLVQARTGLPHRWAVVLVGAAVKAFAAVCCPEFEVRGLDRFLALVRDDARIQRGQGILTFANHISTFDEPLIWASMPLRSFLTPSATRWTLGARDVIFTNSFLEHFFTAGQVVPTNRGQGIFQRALDEGIDLLQHGHWVHIFPEGYVNLSTQMTLRRFKWGISRLLLEAGGSERAAACPPPIVLPIWIQGFDQIMPEQRTWPRWLPRPGARIRITFGHPIPAAEVDAYRAAYAGAALPCLPSTHPIPDDAFFPPRPPHAAADAYAPVVPASRAAVAAAADSDHKRAVRSGLAAFLRSRLAQLGADTRRAAGDYGPGSLAHRVGPYKDVPL